MLLFSGFSFLKCHCSVGVHFQDWDPSATDAFCSEFVRITLYLLVSDLTREISLWSIYLEVVFVEAQSEQCAAIQRARGSALGMVVTWHCVWS